MRGCYLLTLFLLSFVFLFSGNRVVFGAICMGSGSYTYTLSNCKFFSDRYICGSPTALPKLANYTCSWNDGRCGYYRYDNCRCTGGGSLSCISTCEVGGDYWTTSGCSVCTPVDGVSGMCGIADGGVYETYPTSDLCLAGTPYWIDLTANDGVYNWQCLGTAGSCTGSNGTSISCSAYKDSSPTLESFMLKTYDGNVTVATEIGDRNQMCQSVFRTSDNQTGVQFVVTAEDTQGVDDIGAIQVRLRNASNTYTFPAVASSNGVVTISVDLASYGVISDIYNIEVLINDVSDEVSVSWIDTGRDFKYWDCRVSVSGTMYDGSAGSLICPNFGTITATEANFTSLYFKEIGVDDGLETDVNSGAATYTAKSGEYFLWGDNKLYTAQFNNDLAADYNTMDLSLNDNCTQEVGSFSIESVIDPYSTTLDLTANFLVTINQDAWFQSNNGGVLGKSVITDYVPVTCALSVDCTEGISIGSLVAAPVINGTDDIPYSDPNNWYVEKAITAGNINYYEKYKALGVGTTVNGNLTDLSNYNSGLVLVDGDIDINQNKIVAVGDFLMLMASGDITIESSVTRFDGILVGKNIVVSGESDNQLVINGTLYGMNQVNIFRGYSDKSDNNDSPAVKVNFRPDFIFNIPSDVTKSVIDWKWGN